MYIRPSICARLRCQKPNSLRKVYMYISHQGIYYDAPSEPAAQGYAPTEPAVRSPYRSYDPTNRRCGHRFSLTEPTGTGLFTHLTLTAQGCVLTDGHHTCCAFTEPAVQSPHSHRTCCTLSSLHKAVRSPNRRFGKPHRVPPVRDSHPAPSARAR